MDKWNRQIDTSTQEFEEAFGKLTTEELNWKPNSRTWSIAQNIEHLILFNETYFSIIESLLKGTYKTTFLARFKVLVSFLGKAILKGVQPDRKKRMKTFPIWKPAKSEISVEILHQFIAHQTILKSTIKKSKNLIEKRTVISSPANTNIVYELEKAFEIILAHEKRHFKQSKEIVESMIKNPTAREST
jgi:hypothetical protein